MRSLQPRVLITEKFYKCLTRQQSSQPELANHYRYSLNSIARQHSSLLQLYLLYFPSIFNTAYAEQLKRAQKDYQHRQPVQQIMRRNISVFFLTFCRHVALHSLLGQEEKNVEFVVSLSYQMSGKHSQKELVSVVRKVIVQICGQYEYHFKQNVNKPRPWDKTKQILKEMKDNIDRLISQADKNPQNIIKDEFFPVANKRQETVAPLIRRNFERISNIHVFRGQKRKQMLQMLKESYRGMYSVLIPEHRDQRTQNIVIDMVYMLRNTSQIEPVLTSLPIYLKNIHAPNKEINFVIAKDIIILFNQFLRDARHPFPNLKPNCVLISQKSLRPIFEQAELIMDALGIAGNTNTFELDLALAATPSPFDFQKCYLQYLDEVKWLMIKKYYDPKRKEQPDDDEDNKPQDIVNIDGEYTNEKIIIQNIHVWRLLYVIYLVFNAGSEYPETLAFKIYTDSYGSSPFYRDRYISALKDTYRSIRNGEVSIRQIFNLTKAQIYEIKPFGFTMNELCQEFDIKKDDDSMLNSLRFQSIYSQLLLRMKFVKQVMILMTTEKYFKKLTNPKKYIIIYLIVASQNFYQSAIFTHLEQQQAGTRKQIITSGSNVQSGILLADRDKRITMMISIQAKMKEYLKRKDEHYHYLKSHLDIMEPIMKAGSRLEEISKIEKELNQKQIMADLQPQTNDAHKEYINLIETVKRLSFQQFNACIETLDRFTTNQIQNRIDHIEEFHRIEDLSRDGSANQQIGMLLNRRLVLLIKTCTTFRHYNWRTFDTLIQNSLIDQRNYTIRSFKRPLQRMDRQEINQMLGQLSIVEEKINQYTVEPLHFHNQRQYRGTF